MRVESRAMAPTMSAPIYFVTFDLENSAIRIIVWNDVCAVALTAWELLVLRYPDFWLHRDETPDAYKAPFSYRDISREVDVCRYRMIGTLGISWFRKSKSPTF